MPWIVWLGLASGALTAALVGLVAYSARAAGRCGAQRTGGQMRRCDI
jgi:hypothetical protein